MRILHVVGSMNRGGIETWLMHVLRHIDRKQIHMDFLVHTSTPGTYDEEIRALGSRVIPCLAPSKPLQYAYNFRRIVQAEGPYDVIHSHVHHFSGYTLRLAEKNNIPVRIAHAHTNTSVEDTQANLIRHLYLGLMQRWIARHGTLGLGASHEAAAALFNSRSIKPLDWYTLYCGINLQEFHQSQNSERIRREFGIPPDAFVIGHVGRFVEPKNHMFLIEITSQVLQHEPKTVLFLVGDGPLRANIHEKIRRAGLEKAVILAGMRSDVPRLMQGAMDIFVFPSLYEGLGLALIEAQAAGLPCYFSEFIPKEAEIVNPLIHRIALSSSAREWAKAIIAGHSRTLKIDQKRALAQVELSNFSITDSIEKLTRLYRNAVAQSQKNGIDIKANTRVPL